MNRIFVLLILCALSVPAFAQESLDNLPLPRWASVASPEINLRTGPGKRYPIDWILKKKSLPVEVRQEFDNWRLVAEPNGASGWVHRSMLSGARHVMLKHEEALYANPDTRAHITAQLQKGVVAKLAACRLDWCRLEVDSYQGWAPKEALFGVYDKEIFE